MALPLGGPGMYNPNGNNAALLSPEKLQEQQMIKFMHAAMESCAGKAALSGGMGFALGGAFGIFMSSVGF